MGDSVHTKGIRYRNESYDKLLALMLSDMTEEQKSRLPNDLLAKIFRSTDPAVNGLTDAQKDYVCVTALGKRIIKVMLDPDNGMTIEQFFNLKDNWKKKKRADIDAAKVAESMVVNGDFIMAGTDLYNALSYLQLICYSPIFKMVINSRRAAKRQKLPKAEFSLWVDNFMNMMVNYESNKKRIAMEFGIQSVSEWYCLMYFYTGEKKSTSVYKDKFMYAYSSSQDSMKKGLTRLKNAGYLIGRGGNKNNMVSISATGKELVDKVMKKYILNY